MKMARLIALCLLAVLVALAIMTFASRPVDPVYRGRRLSEWLTQLDYGRWPRQETIPADEAIRHMGTNVFPKVEQLLRCRDSALKLRLIKLLHKQSLGRLSIATQRVYHHRAIAACYALGPVAKPLVPKVVEAFGRMQPNEQPEAEQWLGSLGPDADAAIPALVGILRDKNNPVRAFAADALGSISTQRWDDVLPVFTESLRDTDPHVRDVARYAFQLARERALANVGNVPR
jgi:hypothetical protein